jgi:ceramide glucosyltransferase
MHLELLRLIGWTLWGASGAGCLYLLYAGMATRRFAGQASPRLPLPVPVSVLKPLCGEDQGLEENLRSFCRQDHPRMQVVFGVQDPGDPAIAVVRRIIADAPGADLVLVVDGSGRGGNRKVANLQNMLPAARHPVIVMADSDMRVRPDYLAEVTAPLADPATGLVTCLYRGVAADGLWSRLAALYVNHGFLPQAVVAAAFGERNGCFGATIALRRTTLDAIGGFAAVADALADDHALGAAVRRLGLRVVLSPYIVDNIMAEPSLAALFRHELRWVRTIRMISPAGFIGSVVTQPVILALAALALGMPWLAGLAMLGGALACRVVMVRMIDHALRLPVTPLWLVLPRDLLSFVVFAASFFTRKVAWRDRTFRIGRNGQLLDGDRPA